MTPSRNHSGEVRKIFDMCDKETIFFSCRFRRFAQKERVVLSALFSVRHFQNPALFLVHVKKKCIFAEK